MATLEASINSMLISSDSSTYYSRGFRNVLEDHMTFLRKHSETRIIPVTPMQAHQYEFDSTGLLNELGIPLKMHWVVIRMNHLTSLTEVPADLIQLLVPSENEITKLKQLYESSVKKSGS